MFYRSISGHLKQQRDERGAYREDNDDVFLPFHNNTQVESDFKPLERFMDENILNRTCWDEPCA